MQKQGRVPNRMHVWIRNEECEPETKHGVQMQEADTSEWQSKIQACRGRESIPVCREESWPSGCVEVRVSGVPSY